MKDDLLWQFSLFSVIYCFMQRFSRYSIVKLFFEKRILKFTNFFVNSQAQEKVAQPHLQHVKNNINF